MRVLITGITGMAGSFLAEYLADTHPEVEVFGTFRWRSKLDNLQDLRNRGKLNVLDEGQRITDKPSLRRFVKPGQVTVIDCELQDGSAVRGVVRAVLPDRIFHLAAQSFVPTSWTAPAATLTNNIVSQVNLFEAVREANLDPVIHIAGSSEEYGLVYPDEAPIAESNPLRPLSPYAVSKVAQETLALQYFRSYGMRCVVTRGFNHTGPRRGQVFATSSFAKQIAEIENGLRPPVIEVGDLESRRDWTDTRDMVRAYWLATERGQPGEVYNVGQGTCIAVGDMLQILLGHTTTQITIQQDASRMRPSDVKLLWANLDKFRKATEWTPVIPFADTMADLLDYWRERVRALGRNRSYALIVPSQIKFGTDGWRATIADTYTFDNVRIAAQACAAYFTAAGKAQQGVAVGFDTRFGSDRFARAVAEVLAANGVRVLLSDRFQPTPVISYSVIDRQLAGAIIITASHNPAPDNGFKIKSEIGASAPPEVIAAVEQQIDALEASGAPVKRMDLDQALRDGLVERFDATPAYDAQIARLVDQDKLRRAGVHVVADSMYGTGQGYFHRLLSGGATRVDEIRNVVNPAFPGIAPEPIRPHIDELLRTVPERKADLGLATDGDSDRIGLVAEDGTFVNQHQVFALLVLYLTEQRGLRGPAVRSVTMSSMADAYMRRLGQEVFETPVGFKYIGAKMVEENAILGGEESGGFGLQGHLPERDAIVAGLYLVDLMVRLGRPMSGVLAYMREKLGDWHYLRLDVRYPAADRAAIAERVAAARPTELDGSPVTSVGTLDGYKFYAQDGSWLLIRFSGTEPLLRIYTETTSPERVQRLLQQGRLLAGA